MSPAPIFSGRYESSLKFKTKQQQGPLKSNRSTKDSAEDIHIS